MSNDEKTVMFALPNMMSGQLACVAGTAAGRSWDLSAGTFTIGRQEEHDMSLPQEPGISKLHAKIIGQGDRYLITDCESRNGTLLNGELIQRADLYDGDEIRICGCVLRFTQKGGPARPRPRTVEPSVPSTPPQAAAPAVAVPVMIVAPPTPAPSSSRSLGLWYVGGLFSSLLVGGAASAALVISAPPPVVPVVTVPSAVAVVPPVPVPTAPPIVDAGVADVVVDAGAAAAAVDVAIDAGPAPVDVAEPAVPEPEPVELALDEPSRRPSSPPSAKAATGTFAAVVDGGRSEILRTKTGGRVRSVEAKDGAQVVKGTILVTFEAGTDGDEIATLQDRIASLESVEGEEAKRDLRAARARLAALEGSARATPVSASIDGKLTGFNVVVGAVLKPGETIGRVVDGEISTRVKVTIPRGATVRTGDKVRLALKAGGASEGTVVAVNGRVVVVDTGSEPADGVENVTF